LSDHDPNLEKDRQLASQVASGDQRAFDEFFREYFPRLYRFTLSRTDNDHDLAEEIVQRTMCIVVRKISGYRGEALLFTWLCQICRNEMRSVFRKRGIESVGGLAIEDHPFVQAALESMGAEEFRPETIQRREELARFVRTTLEYLPANYAMALEMKYIYGNSVAEIGARLGIGDKAAESVLSRARAAFRDGFRSLWDFDPDYIVD